MLNPVDRKYKPSLSAFRQVSQAPIPASCVQYHGKQTFQFKPYSYYRIKHFLSVNDFVVLALRLIEEVRIHNDFRGQGLGNKCFEWLYLAHASKTT